MQLLWAKLSVVASTSRLQDSHYVAPSALPPPYRPSSLRSGSSSRRQCSGEGPQEHEHEHEHEQ